MTMMAELAEVRRDERVRAFLRARIIFNNQNTSIECTIKNISSKGAKIVLSEALAIPSEFDLEVPQKGRTYRAKLRGGRPVPGSQRRDTRSGGSPHSPDRRGEPAP